MRICCLALLLFVLPVSQAADQASQSDVSLLLETKRAQQRGIDFLVKNQAEDGSWRHHPAITGLAIKSILSAGNNLSADRQRAVDRGVTFILANVKPNGAIYGANDVDKYPNYSTAICAMALHATGDQQHQAVILAAREFLLKLQSDAGGNTVDEIDPSYGGLGYGRRGRPDLSNSSWSYEALRLTEHLAAQAEDSPLTAGGLHWKKAQAFITRCQNLPTHNDQAWAKRASDEDLGGFVYMPGFSFVNEEENLPQDDETIPLRSHGSISYAGLKSYIYADLKKDDPRVQAVIDWLGRHYTLEENPGMGQQGLYYYLHLMTKALTAFGADTFVTADGKTHDWRYELMKRFVQLQHHEGFWQNENNRFWENDPVLVTSYTVIALQILQDRRYL